MKPVQPLRGKACPRSARRPPRCRTRSARPRAAALRREAEVTVDVVHQARLLQPRRPTPLSAAPRTRWATRAGGSVPKLLTPWSRGSRPVNTVVQMAGPSRRPQRGQRPVRPAPHACAPARAACPARRRREAAPGPRPSRPISVTRRGGRGRGARRTAAGRACAAGSGRRARGMTSAEAAASTARADGSPRERCGKSRASSATSASTRPAPRQARARHRQPAQELERHRMAVAEEVEREQRGRGQQRDERHAPNPGKPSHDRARPRGPARRGAAPERRHERRDQPEQHACPRPRRAGRATRAARARRAAAWPRDSGTASAARRRRPAGTKRGQRWPGSARWGRNYMRRGIIASIHAPEPRHSPGRARAPRRRLRAPDLPPSGGGARGTRGPVRDDQGRHHGRAAAAAAVFDHGRGPRPRHLHAVPQDGGRGQPGAARPARGRDGARAWGRWGGRSRRRPPAWSR